MPSLAGPGYPRAHVIESMTSRAATRLIWIIAAGIKRPIGGDVARLFLALLLALALLPTPGSAMVVPAPDCVMAQDGMAMPPAGHDDGCCTDQCVMVSGAMALPSAEAAAQPPELVALPHWTATPPAFRSANPAAADPPPRP